MPPPQYNYPHPHHGPPVHPVPPPFLTGAPMDPRLFREYSCLIHLFEDEYDANLYVANSTPFEYGATS